jgi:hypothetical protein
VARQEAQRQRVLNELISSENKYVENLRVLVHVFHNPLHAVALDEDGFLTLDELNAVFSNVGILFRFHQSFLEDMRSKPIPQVCDCGRGVAC